MSGERAVVDALLACLPLSADGTGHVVDCGYDHDAPTCGCYTLPERFGRVVAARVASAAAERDEQIRALAEEFRERKERAAEWAARTSENFREAMSRKVAWEAAEEALRALLDAAPAGGEGDG